MSYRLDLVLEAVGLLDEAGFYSNMQLDGGPHLIEMAADAKVFNF